MTKNDMLRSLLGTGILLFFLWFVSLSIIADSWLYLETVVRVSVSVFMTAFGLVIRYLTLRMRKLEQQMEYLAYRLDQLEKH